MGSRSLPRANNLYVKHFDSDLDDQGMKALFEVQPACARQAEQWLWVVHLQQHIRCNPARSLHASINMDTCMLSAAVLASQSQSAIGLRSTALIACTADLCILACMLLTRKLLIQVAKQNL